MELVVVKSLGVMQLQMNLDCCKTVLGVFYRVLQDLSGFRSSPGYLPAESREPKADRRLKISSLP